MLCFSVSVLLVLGLWVIQKHLPKGTIKVDYFKESLEILDEGNIPTF